jgi:amidohydrolase
MKDTLKSTIQELATQIFPQVVEIRRDLHANPELAFEEVRTAAKVSAFLSAQGIEHQCNIAKTGVVALINPDVEGPAIALRADMDALPIHEQNQHAYCSTRPGKMHACGHDAHTASLLGTAFILNQLKAHIKGKIKLIFQPSEEKSPGGASVMIKEGVLRNPDVTHILGQHVMPQLPVGKIGIRSGKYMASADEIYLTITGKGGHGAMPHLTIDPVAVAAQIIVSLQQVISRIGDPRIPSVLTFGKIIAEGATNIIPNTVYLEGTFRTFDETWRSQAKQHIEKITHSIATAFGATAALEIRTGYPVLYNDPSLTERTRQHLAQYVGEENIVALDLWTAAEDFAFYAQEIPGCFYRLGTRNESKGIVHGLHTPLFDIDEEALQFSTGLMAWAAIQQLAD